LPPGRGAAVRPDIALPSSMSTVNMLRSPAALCESVPALLVLARRRCRGSLFSTYRHRPRAGVHVNNHQQIQEAKMPTFTIETTYRVPNYRLRTHSADSVEEACRLAIDDENWSDAIPDFETAGETYVTGAWQGENAANSGLAVDIPEAFGETIYRKAALFEDLVALLRAPAQPMGISEHDFRNWLPRAMTTLAEADAIDRDAAASP
jgi:hypothetical protein